MTVTLAVALLALLVALFALVALVAVYVRVRGLEAGAAAGLTGYPTLVGRPAPASVRPGPGDRCALVAVLDGDCTLCRDVLAALAGVATDGVRVVALTDRALTDRALTDRALTDRALTDRAGDHPLPGGAVRVDAAARAELFEGYTPTVLAVDTAGTVVARRFVYADTDVPALLRELTAQAARTAQAAHTMPAAQPVQRGVTRA